MKISVCAAIAATFLVSLGSAGERTGRIFESAQPPKASGRIDKIVFARLAELNIEPVLCSDSVFVRRAFLDVIGTLPTAAEARAFLTDKTKNKRVALIDQLMKRDEFADYWSMRWGDILRIKAEFPVNLWPNAAQAYHRWVHASIADNKPYDQFARELLTSSGSNFRVGPVNFYRAIQNKTPQGIATAVALTLMGTRADTWPEAKLKNLAEFFSQIGYKPTREWKEEFVFWDPLGSAAAAAPSRDEQVNHGPADIQRLNATREAVFPDGTKVRLGLEEDPRKVFADWLIRPENPWFTKSIANRMWSWITGRGIIHEPDDLRDDNQPSNPQLLAYLEEELIASNYDLNHLLRLILTSKTYQFSSNPLVGNQPAVENFARYPLRRLEAEVIIDAVNRITGTTDLYTSAIPEPFTYIPSDLPAIALADGSITSPFLALFGRSARATGMENERINRLSSAQWLHLLNSSHIQQKLERSPKLRAMLVARRKPPESIRLLYLTVLSRFPTEDEVQAALQYGKPAGRLTRNDWLDITWALINSQEFLFRH